jgi:protein TonB
MFEQAVLSNCTSGRRAWATGLGVTIESVLVGAAVLFPMLWPQALPRPQALIALLEPVAPPAPVHQTAAAQRPRVIRENLRPQVLLLPIHVPPRPVMIDDPPAEIGVVGMPDGIGIGQANGPGLGLITGILERARTTPLPRIEAAAPPARPTPAAPVRIRPGGQVKMARLVHRVEPIYPSLARNMRVQGTVELSSVIDVDGRLKELRVLSGHPLLAGAALDAVKQWIYEPTYLNGDPVEVIAPIIVTFKLNQ